MLPLEIYYLRLATRFEGVLRFDPYEVLTIISELGFVLLPIARQALPPVKPFVGRISISGPVAERGEFILDIDCDKAVLGLSIKQWIKDKHVHIPNLIDEFDSVVNTISKIYEIKPAFYELLSEVKYRIHKPDKMIKLELDNNLILDIVRCGATYCHKNLDSRSNEWFEFVTRPSGEHAQEAIAWIVFRHPNKDYVYTFLRNLLEVIKKILSYV